MATATLPTTETVEQLLGDDAASLLEHRVRDGAPRRCCTCRGPISSTASGPAPTAPTRCCATSRRSISTAGSAAPATCRSSRSTRASSTPPARRSLPIPSTSTPASIVELAVEGGCNAVASTFGVLGRGVAALGAPDPVHRQAQPQRAADLSEQRSTRSCSAPSSEAWNIGAVAVGATIYFGSDGGRPPDPGGVAGVRRGARARHGHDPLVLPAQPGLQEGRRRLRARRRSHRSGEPPRRHHRGRHHQAEAADQQRRIHGAQLRQDRGRRLHEAHVAITRSTSAATRCSTATRDGSA